MLYHNLDYWCFGICPSSGILKNTQRFENWICFRPQVYLLSWVRLKVLTSITGNVVCFLEYQTIDKVQNSVVQESHSPKANSTLSYSRQSPPFMAPEGSSPCSQEPAAGPCPKPDESNPHFKHYFPKIHFNIILPCTPRSSEWSLSFGLSNTNFVLMSQLPMRATWLTNIILLDFMISMLFGEQYKLWRKGVCEKSNQDINSKRTACF
jgi:hypothetical protein